MRISAHSMSVTFSPPIVPSIPPPPNHARNSSIARQARRQRNAFQTQNPKTQKILPPISP
jgi:hypothetical protein